MNNILRKSNSNNVYLDIPFSDDDYCFAVQIKRMDIDGKYCAIVFGKTPIEAVAKVIKEIENYKRSDSRLLHYFKSAELSYSGRDFEDLDWMEYNWDYYKNEDIIEIN